MHQIKNLKPPFSNGFCFKFVSMIEWKLCWFQIVYFILKDPVHKMYCGRWGKRLTWLILIALLEIGRNKTHYLTWIILITPLLFFRRNINKCIAENHTRLVWKTTVSKNSKMKNNILNVRETSFTWPKWEFPETTHTISVLSYSKA